MQAEPDIAELEPRAAAIRRHVMERITPLEPLADKWRSFWLAAAPKEPTVEEVT